MRTRFALVSVLVVLASSLFAQEFRATLTGHVLDPSGAAVPNATVQVRNAENNEVSSARTDSSGVYTIPLLRPATYTVTVEATGFKKYLREGLTLQVGQVAGVNVTLEVGAVTETVNVTAEAPLLETETADRGGVVDTKQVAELPLNARNPYMLGAVMSGVTFNGSPIWQRPFDNGAIAQWSINGGWQSNNEFLLDGAPNNAQQGGNNVAYVAIVDAVQEFRVQTNSYDAQYGHSSGGIMNVILKSGANDFHATGWEFMRRTFLDANTFQNNAIPVAPGAPGTAKTTHYLDQYGWQFSGPIVIPKLYNGKNKSFFLGSYEGYREGSPAPLINSVPAPEFLNGDFSKLVDGLGNRITIYNPFSGRADTSVPGGWKRDPFPNNVIPQALLNPVAQKVLGYFPKPNATTAGASYSNSNLLLPDYFDTDKFYNLILKFDQNIGDKHRLFFRHASNDRTENRAVNGIVSGPGQDGQQPFQRINDAYVLDWVGNLAPTLVANARFSYNRFIENGDGFGNKGFDITTFGLPASLAKSLPGGAYFGRWDFDGGYNSLGRYLSKNLTNNYSLNGNITKIWGSHGFHMGLDVRRGHYLISDTGNVLFFRSRTDFTQEAYNQTIAGRPSGNSLASFMLGLPWSDSNVNFNAYPFFRTWYYAPFIQDDWKVSRRLTLNLGLRWDINTPPDEKYHRLVYAFDPDAANPVSSQIDKTAFPQFANIKGAMQFTGVNGNPERPAGIYWKAFQPRIGGAFQINKRVLMRAGFGVYYLNPNNDWNRTEGFSAQTPLISSNDGNRTPARADLLSNPYPNGITPPTGSSLGALTFMGRNFTWFNNKDFVTPRQHQFSLGFQIQMPLNSVLDVSYVGARGYNYQMNQQYNNPSLAFRKQCNPLEGGSPTFCNANVPSPFFNVPAFQGTSLYTSSTITRFNLNRPYPQFNGGLQENGINRARTWYNSAQINYNMRIKGGLNLLANYTFSKFIEQWGFLDQYADVLQRGPYFLDKPHVVKLTAVYALPLGRGKRFAGNVHGVLDKLISGWEANTFMTTQSGEPANLPGNVLMLRDVATKNVNWHQYQVRLWGGCVFQLGDDGVTRTATSYSLSTASSCPTTTNAAGAAVPDFAKYDWEILPQFAPNVNTSRAARIRIAHVTTMDFSLNKTTQITERLKFQFRAEAFNILNHYTMPLQNVNTTATSVDFGTLYPSRVCTSCGTASGYPRQIQLGFKILW